MKNFAVTVLAVALVLGVYEWFKMKQVEKYVGAAYITEGMVLAQSKKRTVAAYYEVHGKLPSSNADTGMGNSNQYLGETVSALTVTEGGVITIKFNEKSGVKDGLIRYTPNVNDSVNGISWSCTSPSFKDIATWAPQCQFQK